MVTDYDAPRRGADELETDSLEGLKAAEKENAAIDDNDDGDIVEPYDLPDADLSGEELSVSVVPKQADEFTCGSCFLVQHRNRIGTVEPDGTIICQDCA